MPRWFDRAVQEIEEACDSGEIDNAERNKQIGDLQQELRAAADEAGEQARDDYYN